MLMAEHKVISAEQSICNNQLMTLEKLCVSHHAWLPAEMPLWAAAAMHSRPTPAVGVQHGYSQRVHLHADTHSSCHTAYAVPCHACSSNNIVTTTWVL